MSESAKHWALKEYKQRGEHLQQICIKECFVRCKDCKYWDKEQTQCNYRLLTEDAHMKVLADDFCSRGVKK